MIQNAASHAALNSCTTHRTSTLLMMFGKHTENRMTYHSLSLICTENIAQPAFSPASDSKSSTHGVHTRFPISGEMVTPQLLAKAETTIMIPHKRCEQALRAEVKTKRMFRGLKESKAVYEELKRAKKTRKALEKQHIKKLKALSRQTESLRASIRDAAMEIDTTRRHYETLISKEKQRADDAERTKLVAVSSLRSRWEKQKSDLQEELTFLRSQNQMLRDDLNVQNQDATELKTCWEESKFDVDVLKGKLAIMQDDELMRLISREISDALSEVSNVVLLRQHEGACMVDKFRELNDVVKELVREVENRRKSSVKTIEKICNLEEERLKWIGIEGIGNEYHPLM